MATKTKSGKGLAALLALAAVAGIFFMKKPGEREDGRQRHVSVMVSWMDSPREDVVHIALILDNEVMDEVNMTVAPYRRDFTAAPGVQVEVLVTLRGFKPTAVGCIIAMDKTVRAESLKDLVGGQSMDCQAPVY